MNPSYYFQKLISAGEENLPAWVNKLKGKAATEGELVGDLVKKSAPRTLPVIEEGVSEAPGLIGKAEEEVPDLLARPSEAKAPGFMDMVNNLTPGQKAFTGAAALTAAASPLLPNSSSKNSGSKNSGSENSEFHETPQEISHVSQEKQPYTKVESAPEQKVEAESIVSDKPSVVDNALQSNTDEIEPSTRAEDPFKQRLEEARQKDADHSLMFGLLKAAQMGGSALAGSKADTSYADSELSKENPFTNKVKTDMDIMRQHADIIEKEKLEDPNSDISKQTMEAASKIYPQIAGKQLSAAQLHAMGINMGTIGVAMENIKSREALAKQKADDLRFQKQQHADLMGVNTANKDSKDFEKAIDYGSKARGTNPEAKANLDRSTRILSMFSTLPTTKDGSMDFSKVDALQKAELVKSLDVILSGKSTISGSKGLEDTTQSYKDKVAHVKQMILGDGLVPIGQQDTVKKIFNTIERERDVIGWQLAQAAGATAKAHKHISKDDVHEQIYSKFGITPVEQDLINDYHLNPNMMLSLKQRGIKPEDALELLKSGKKIQDITGNKAQVQQNSTTIPSSNKQITVTDKTTGQSKLMDSITAQKIIAAHPERFEGK